MLLASADDVTALLGGFPPDDPSRVDALLGQASARFRVEAEHNFDAAETTLILHLVEQSVILPYRPVLGVSEVRAVDETGTPSTILGGWMFDGIGTVRLADYGWAINAAAYRAKTVAVTWEHGYETVPEDVRWTVAQMAARALSSPAPAAVTGETVGAYSYQTGATAASGASGMTADEMRIARKYRARPNSASVIL